MVGPSVMDSWKFKGLDLVLVFRPLIIGLTRIRKSRSCSLKIDINKKHNNRGHSKENKKPFSINKLRLLPKNKPLGFLPLWEKGCGFATSSGCSLLHRQTGIEKVCVCFF